MNNKNFNKSRKGESFQFGISIVLFAIAISSFAFVSEENKITGFAAFENNQEESAQDNLMEFKNINSLSTLAAGNYYIDGNGIVYWIDDESRPALAKVGFIDESQKYRHIYIDNEGRIGYVLNTISINENR